MTLTQCSLDVGIQDDYKKFWFTVPGKIVGKGRPRFTTFKVFDKVKNKYVTRVKVYTPQTTVDYEQKIAMCYRKTTSYQSDKALRVKIFAYREIPK